MLIDQLNNDIAQKNAKVTRGFIKNQLIENSFILLFLFFFLMKISNQMQEIDNLTIDLLNYKARCDDQERDLDNYRNQLNENDLNNSTHLASKEEVIHKLQNEVYLYIFSLIFLSIGKI